MSLKEEQSAEISLPKVTGPVNLPRKSWQDWFRSGWAALLFFTVATIGFSWPLAIGLSNTLPDWGDPPDVAWKIGTVARQLLTDPFNLYHSGAFYPLKNGLALGELTTGQGLLAAPVVWLTANLVLAYNLLNFLSYLLSGWAMWLLVRHLTGSSRAGLVAGMIYSFSPWHYGQYGHLPLSAQQWMIFALYFLIRFLEGTQTTAAWKKRNFLYLGLFVLFFVLQAIASGYYAYFETILVGIYLIYYFLFASGLAGQVWQRLRRKSALSLDRRRLAQQFGLVVGAGIVAFGLILPFVVPFIQAQRTYNFKRDLSEISYWSAAPTSLLRMSDRSWLYKPVERGLFNLQTSVERELYPGLITLLLAATGLWFAFRRRKASPDSATDYPDPQSLAATSHRPAPTPIWAFAALSLSGLILSFGPSLYLDAYGLSPTGLSLPYAWFYSWVPGWDALRVAGRFAQLFMLGLAVCAGYGVAFLSATGKTQNATFSPASPTQNPVPKTRFPKLSPRNLSFLFSGLLLVLVSVEFFAPGVPSRPTGTGEAAPPLYRWLAGPEAARIIPKDALLLELPINDQPTAITSNPIYLMYSLAHGRPMLNGSANIVPPGYERLRYEMLSFPSPATLDLAEGLGVQFVLIHTKGLSADANRAELERQTGPDGRLELVKTFEAYDGDSRFKDGVYRVKATPQRFQKLSKLIPPGAEVLLVDHPNGKRLYTAALPRLIGPDRQYFSNYTTIYRDIPGNAVQAAQANRVYEYAIFYRGSGTLPTEFGYNPSDLLPNDENDIIQVYRKRPGLASFFSFQDDTNSARYLPFSARNPAYLGVADGTVRQITPKEASGLPKTSPNTQTLALVLATAEAQTINLKTGGQEKKQKIEPGFYRWRVNVETPGAMELSLETSGWAYLIQARLYAADFGSEEAFEQLRGYNGAIVQASSAAQEGEPGVVTSRLVYYVENRPNTANPPGFLFQINIVAQNGPHREAASEPISTPVPAEQKIKPTPRRFGEWAVSLPPAQPGLPQTLELRVNLLEQKAVAVVGGQIVPPTIGMPLSTVEGYYQAQVNILQLGANATVQATPLNADASRTIQTYGFRFLRLGSQPALGDLRFDAPNALIVLPSVDN